tara:strand:- start:41 stop:337 length:297 start_codon:yes stop_codon:yes gene_type:complete
MSDYPDYIVGDVYVVTALIGGCAKAGDEWILPEGKTLPSQKEIDAKRKELQADYDSKQYQRDRVVAYDPIPEQLDQIYHDMDGWKAKIKSVKDKYPKP